jgi:hypothetical protein
VSLNFHEIGIGVFTFASVLSLLFLIAKALAKEFLAVALVWIRVFKKLKAEWQKPLKNESTFEPPQLLDRTRSNRGLG